MLLDVANYVKRCQDFELDKFSIGGFVITFDGLVSVISGIHYKSTPGSYEPLFKKYAKKD